METKLIDYGAAIAALYFVLQILKIVLDFRKNKGGVFNGATTQVLSILDRLADTSTRQVTILEGIREVNQANGSKLENLNTNVTLAMERQKATMADIREIRHVQKRTTKGRSSS